MYQTSKKTTKVSHKYFLGKISNNNTENSEKLIKGPDFGAQPSFAFCNANMYYTYGWLRHCWLRSTVLAASVRVSVWQCVCLRKKTEKKTT